MTDILAAIRARITELGLTRAELARRCQKLHHIAAPRGWDQRVWALLGPEESPRTDLGGTQAHTLLVVLEALDLDVVPRENRQAISK